MGIDLHTHSNASDGTDDPADLVAGAAAAGLRVVALTDHDTTAGWARAIDALPAGLTLIRGAELSCVWMPESPAEPPVSVHLLAYLFDPAEPALAAERARVREGRLGRAKRMVELMAADGVSIDWPAVQAEANGGPVGRPHVARALVRRGVVASMEEAFTSAWIGAGGRYRVAKPDTDVLTGIRLVRRAGGVPVFAHPLAARRGRVVPDEAFSAMAAAGLGGIEADHFAHESADRARARAIAAEFGLFVTGSSDFHGGNQKVAIGAETTTEAAYETLLAQATGLAPVER